MIFNDLRKSKKVIFKGLSIALQIIESSDVRVQNAVSGVPGNTVTAETIVKSKRVQITKEYGV